MIACAMGAIVDPARHYVPDMEHAFTLFRDMALASVDRSLCTTAADLAAIVVQPEKRDEAFRAFRKQCDEQGAVSANGCKWAFGSCSMSCPVSYGSCPPSQSHRSKLNQYKISSYL